MLKIGLSGGIGSGKTLISKIFQELGVPVYYADLAAKRLMNSSFELSDGIKELFGENAYLNNKLDRKLLARLVFENKSLLHKLNKLVHPAVEKDFSDWCTTHSSKPYILKEAAVLFESGSYKQLDKVIVVSAPENVRIERVTSRDNSTVKEVLDRIKNQWPTEKLAALADFIIENDGKKLILPQVIKIDEKIKNIWQNLESGLEQV